MTSLLLVLLTFSLFSYRMNLINHRIDEVLFEESGVKFVVYGDANSLYGFANGEKEYRSINEAIEEIVDDIDETEGARALRERFLSSRKIYSADDVWDKDFYTIVYTDQQSEEVIATLGPIGTISRDVRNNRHYETALAKFNPNSTDIGSMVDSYPMNPVFIGVNDAQFSDLSLGYISIIEGRTFTSEELESGSRKMIVNQNAYLLEREGYRKVEAGDTIPITIEIEGDIEVFEFEVIGIDNGKRSGGILLPAGLSDSEPHGQNYHSYFYIPEKCFEEIRDSFHELAERNDVPLIKTDYYGKAYDEDHIFYSLYGSYRPIVIEVSSYEAMETVADFISEKISDLNRISSRSVQYTYYTNADNLVTVIGTIISNEKLFGYLSVFSILLNVIILSVLFINDLDSRKKEIGIFEALGRKKETVLFSVFSEYILLSIIPIILAVFISELFTNRYLRFLNEHVLYIEREEEILGSYISVSALDPNTVSVSAGAAMVIVLLFVLSIVFACILGYIHVKKMNTREILQEADR